MESYEISLPLTPNFRPFEASQHKGPPRGTLGKGTFGKVDSHTYQGRTYAVKVHSRKGISTQALREVSSMVRMNHPNVMRAISAGCWNGSIYIVMEKATSDLENYLVSANGNPADMERLCYSITYQLLCGLGYCHSRGVVHRDIKPNNVLVFDSPSGVKVKICDFGSAKVLLGKSRPYSELASRNYRPPEACLGGTYDFSADLWSLGVVIWEIFHLTLGGSIKRLNYLFDSKTEYGHFLQIVNVLGIPSNKEYYKDMPRWGEFVTKIGFSPFAILPNPFQEKKIEIGTPRDILPIIENLMDYTPSSRKSAIEILKMDLFNPYRDCASAASEDPLPSSDLHRLDIIKLRSLPRPKVSRIKKTDLLEIRQNLMKVSLHFDMPKTYFHAIHLFQTALNKGFVPKVSEEPKIFGTSLSSDDLKIKRPVVHSGVDDQFVALNELAIACFAISSLLIEPQPLSFEECVSTGMVMSDSECFLQTLFDILEKVGYDISYFTICDYFENIEMNDEIKQTIVPIGNLELLYLATLTDIFADTENSTIAKMILYLRCRQLKIPYESTDLPEIERAYLNFIRDLKGLLTSDRKISWEKVRIPKTDVARLVDMLA